MSGLLNILSMEWMGKQNYPPTNTDCYQWQWFCSRAITRFVQNPWFGQDWFIIELTDSDLYSKSCQFSTLSLFSLDNEVCNIALCFVYIAKCLRKWAVVRLETNNYELEPYENSSVSGEFVDFFNMNSFWDYNDKELQMCLTWKAFLCGS